MKKFEKKMFAYADEVVFLKQTICRSLWKYRNRIAFFVRNFGKLVCMHVRKKNTTIKLAKTCFDLHNGAKRLTNSHKHFLQFFYRLIQSKTLIQHLIVDRKFKNGVRSVNVSMKIGRKNSSLLNSSTWIGSIWFVFDIKIN